MNTAHGVDTNDRSHTGIVKGLEVRPVIHLMGWNTVWVTMARQEHHRLITQAPLYQGR